MSNNIYEFTDADFDQQVIQSDSPVLVDFWAAWCGPCRAVSPVIDQLAAEYGQKIKVGKLNIDDNPATTAEFGISSIPAVLLFDRGAVVQTLIGVQPVERYRQAIESVSAAAA